MLTTPRRPAGLRLEALEDRVTPALAGALDSTFDVDGRVLTLVPGVMVKASVVQPDGKLVVAGSANGVGGIDYFFARYDVAGALDPTFGQGGIKTFPFQHREVANGLAVEVIGGESRILFCGNDTTVDGSGWPTAQEAVIGRLRPNGDLDTTFNPGGRVPGLGFLNDATGTGTEEFAAVAVDAQGRIVTAGTLTVVRDGVTQTDAWLTRCNPDGSGLVRRVIPHAGDDMITGMALRATDGLIGLVGTTGLNNFFVATWTDDLTAYKYGQLDFATTGGEIGFGVGFLPDGGMAVSGLIGLDWSANVGTDFGVSVVDVDATSLRSAPGFNGGRPLKLDMGGGSADSGARLAVDGGKIVVVGATRPAGGTNDFMVVRLNPDGTLDTTFNGSGRQGGPFTSGVNETANSVTVLPDGRIVVVGGRDAGGAVLAARLTGPAGPGRRLTVDGPGAVAAVYAPTPGGGYDPTPAGTVKAFPGLFSIPNYVRSATGDVDGDGTEDAVVVTGPGTPLRVAVVSGADHATFLVAPFDPFGGDFTGGGYVTSTDLDGDGRAEFAVTPDEGGGPRVTVFSRNADGTTAVRANFFGIDDANFRGGCRAAFGDVNGDRAPDVVVAAGFGGGPRTAIFTGQSVLAGAPARLTNDFFAFPGADAVTLRNGSFVAAGDVDGDGKADLIFGGGPGGAPRVFILSGAMIAAGNLDGAYGAPIANFFVAGNVADRGGVRVAAKFMDADWRADVVVGAGDGGPSRARVYRGADFTSASEPAPAHDLDPFGWLSTPGGVFVG